MATRIDDDEPTLPVLDDTPVAARHILPAEPGDDGAVEVLPNAWWAPAPHDGLTGDDGWVSASLERRSRDASQLQGLVLPNTTGRDGILHRDRFAARTDPQHRIGTEWLEFVDEKSGDPLGVVTTETGRADRTTVNVSGPDGAALLSGFREGKVAPWTPHSPGDVIDRYTRAAQTLTADVFTGAGGLNDWTPTTARGGTVTPTAAGITLAARGPNSPTASINRTLDGPPAGAPWTLTARLRFGDADVGGYVQLFTGAVSFELRYPTSGGGGPSSLTARVTAPGSPGYVDQHIASAAFTPNDLVELSITAIDGWFIFLRDGAVVAQMRRPPVGAASVSVLAASATVTVDSVEWATSRPFLRRAAPRPDQRVAGLPAPGGLRGDYFLTFDEWAKSNGSFTAYGTTVLAPIGTPYAQRLDPTIAFFGNAWMPVGPPSGFGFAVRWSGSIYLDLEPLDIQLRIGSPNNIARLWVGSVSGAPAIDAWAADQVGDSTAGRSMREHLGTSESGWYPIVLEYAFGDSGLASVYLQRTTEANPWTDVPATQLSPFGCWEGDLGGESYRGAVDSVCNTAGLVWRLQPKVLESGEFPGRLEYGGRVGTDTTHVLGENEATEYVSETRSVDVVDQVVADAQGLGDNLGREGLTATLTDPAAVDRPWTLTRAETLSDITEQNLLRQRLSTILALYGTPAEEIAARPRGVTTLTDRFPTAGGALSDEARVLRWEPDDGVRCRFPSVGVDDQTPRAMTTVTWQITPGGRAAPPVGFRQRPRHLRETLRRLQRGLALQRRRYQGQLSYLTGTIGSTSTSVATDRYSRVSLPVGAVAKLEVQVTYISGEATLEVCGTPTGMTITAPGRYDVTGFLPAGRADADARLTSASSFGADLQILATVRL